ncbi:hypothetical protein BDZ97DRAFT_1679381 [Flammula alnicola]|nr:hypothetical protein BDZ97DRAFT_1679381 [Flammula alnicola]
MLEPTQLLQRDPSAEYRIMWYRQQYRGPECKVDILVPGIMHLPHLRPERVLLIEDLPVVPFALLLLHKLQGWDDHCKAEVQHKKQKQAADGKRLMGLRHQVQILQDTTPWVDEELFNDEFWALTMERVKAYCAVFPDRADDWKALGFEIDS